MLTGHLIWILSRSRLFGCSWMVLLRRISEKTQTVPLHQLCTDSVTAELHTGQTWSWNKTLTTKGYLATAPSYSLFVQHSGYCGSSPMAETTMCCRNCTCTTVLIINTGLWNCQCINFPSQLYIHYCQILSFRERSQIQPFHTEN